MRYGPRNGRGRESSASTGLGTNRRKHRRIRLRAAAAVLAYVALGAAAAGGGTAPSAPSSVGSTSHTVGVWSNERRIAIEWSGSIDGGAGIAGYSILFDNAPATVPDVVVDVTQGVDPHSASSEPLADAPDHWFHVRACDAGGSCSAAAHLGPFPIDATHPADPSSLASTTHTAESWSTVNQVEMEWSGATDSGGSGLDGYSVVFDTSDAAVAVPLHELTWGSAALDTPYDIAADGDGNVFVADSQHHRVVKYDAAGTLLGTWGSLGSGLGSFNLPLAVATSPAGNVYVADTFNHRVQRFDGAGAFLDAWGSNGSGDGQFNLPRAITVDDAGKVYVGDAGNDRVQVFDASGAFLGKWGSPGLGNGQFDLIDGLATDSLGNVYVSDVFADRVQKFDATGTFLGKFGFTGSIPGFFNGPGGMVVDDDDNLYVADADNGRIQKFDPSGSFLLLFGMPGAADGQFVLPRGLARDVNGHIFVADRGNDRVQRFAIAGLPDVTVDVVHDGDPHSTASGALSDGDNHYFHLRTCDLAGNCTTTLQEGPFWIDVTDPLNAADVASSSHTVGVPSTQKVMQMTWTPGSDATSGLDGYAVEFNGSATPVCSEVKNREEQAMLANSGLLSDGSWWFHICARDNAGNWSTAASSGPFVVDATPPSNPILSSTSHTTSTWSGLDQITIQWSGAVDTGSGVAGYSVVFNNSAGTQPDTTVDVAHGSDPQQTTSTTLLDGAHHWFHLRTCDQAGACSAAVHLGPFWIDTVDPLDPTMVASSSHVVGSASNVDVIDISWAAGSDATSGVDGYAYVFNQTPTPTCDEGKDLEQNATSISSGALADGSWYFHICTVDNAGRWTSTVTTGPFEIDTVAPTAPSAVASTSHTVDVWSALAEVALEWSGAADGGSGLAGYSVLFDGEAATPPDEIIEVSQSMDPHSWTAPAQASGGDYWFRIRPCDDAGNCGSTVSLGPFKVDVDAPAAPSPLASTTHEPGVWSNASEIVVAWSGAADTHSGLDGYSVLFDNQIATLPDATVDVTHATDPHQTSSGSSTDGADHWFHLRTCDLVGNCSTAAHLGPFQIDTVDPIDPGNVQSTSHDVGVPSTDDTIEMSWTSGSDAASGLDGYAFTFSASPAPQCDQTKDLEEAAITVSSAALADGEWWFHICTVDNAGNWTATVTVGPYAVDASPPAPPTIVASTTHVVDVWSNRDQVRMEWSGSVDAGAGMAGYSLLFDHSPSTEPNTTVDLAQSIDPHSVLSDGLADGDHWFHLRACDNLGTCSEAVHVGPYRIDRVAPDDPTALASTSHLEGGWSNQSQLTMQWSGAVDSGGSGLAGYSVAFDDTDAESATPVFALLWGGPLPGAFQSPVGIVVGPGGEVYVSDRDNDRVRKFGANGEPLLDWGSSGSGPGELAAPTGVAVDGNGDVYVVDSGNHRIQKFTSTGAFLLEWGSQGSLDGELETPGGIAVGPGGDVYVADSNNHRVQKFDSSGGFLAKWGSLGSGDGELMTPQGVAADGFGNVFVVDTSNHRIQKFSSDGTFLASWGAFGSAAGELAFPRMAVIDAAGRLVVADTSNHRLQRFDTEGALLDVWGANGVAEGSFELPQGVAAATGGDLYVADTGNHRVQKFVPATLPDTTVDVAHGIDPQSVTSEPLADGADHFFHLRTCDVATNCTTTRHAGPFGIDTADPEPPTEVVSSSHTVGVATSLGTVDMSWTAAVDALSGLDGYAYELNGSAAPVCDESKDLAASAVSLASVPLADGDWWFHICAVDVAGNWSATVSAGPFLIDSLPPTIVAVSSVADTGDGVLEAAETTAVPLTQILVSFDEAMYDPAGDTEVGDVTHPDNYRLFAAGPNGTLQSIACGAPVGDDVSVSLSGVDYDSPTQTVSIRPGSSLALGASAHRLVVCGASVDLADNALDGNADGSPGDDFVLDFAVSLSDLLLNPNFDQGLGEWTLDGGAGDIVPQAADADLAPSSGSALIDATPGPTTPAGISQCLALGAGGFYRAAGSARISSGSAVAPALLLRVEAFTTPDCSKAPLVSLEEELLVGDTVGAWTEFGPAAITVPASAQTLRVSFIVEPGGAAELDVGLDRLFFGPGDVLFGDGFESGDTTAWSVTTP